MKTLQELNINLNRHAAEVFGWTGIFQIGGSLMGRPPNGSPRSRDQALVPDWAGDFNACCELGLTYRFTPHQASVESFMYDLRNEHGIELDFKTAYRHFMLRKVIERVQEGEKFHPAMAA